MSTLTKGSPAKSKVTGAKGYIAAVHDRVGDQLRYSFLHLNAAGDRTESYLPAYEVEGLPPGNLPPFTLFETTGPGEPGEPGTAVAG